MHVGNDDLECWFLTGSQHLYGDETLRQVAVQSAEVVAKLDEAHEIGVRVVAKPVLTGWLGSIPKQKQRSSLEG